MSDSLRFRQRSWRFYRNWLIFMLMWAILIVVVLRAFRSSWPGYVYVIVVYPVYLLGSAIFYAYRHTHPPIRFAMHRVTPADAGMDYEKVEFPSRDGLMLFGWYVPGRSRSVVILLHGLASKGISMIYHASALVAHGFGVLMFDLRAHGSSEGDTCTMGRLETYDLLGAVDYLRTREDVDGDKIGALGLSLGALVALRTAAQGEALRGVVAEGPSPATLADQGGRPTTLWRWINYPADWLYYKLLSFMNGTSSPAGVLAEIGGISPRPILLISAGTGGERQRTRLFYDAAAEPKELWEVPEARHAEAYFVQPQLYAQRVATFFEGAFTTATRTNPAVAASSPKDTVGRP